jgi:hypothetical protein
MAAHTTCVDRLRVMQEVRLNRLISKSTHMEERDVSDKPDAADYDQDVQAVKWQN